MPQDRHPGSPSLDLQWELTGETAQLRVSGELDMAAAFKLEPEIERVVAEREVNELVIDLGGVTFMDSSGLGSLLSTRDRMSDLDIEAKVVAASEPVRRVLGATGTDDVLLG